VTESLLDFITAGSPFPSNVISGDKEIPGVYDIRASLCLSKTVAPSKRVRLLSRGVLFGRSYWDFALDGYSYFDVATASGDAVLFYDRLGVGESEKPDPINDVQAALEVSSAHSLAAMLRKGAISNCAFNKVIGVGHSFGSVLTSSITTQYPADFDAVVLTGFTLNLTGIPMFWEANALVTAQSNRPARFGQLSNGYLVGESATTVQQTCFRAAQFAEYILQEHERTKETVTLGEIFSVASVVAPAVKYDKPVLVVNGENDLPFCFGNCTYPTDFSEPVLGLYPALAKDNSKFKTLMVEGTGHGVNLHYTAQKAFEWIQKTLKDVGV
jgi:pimeloyl-ACP methyl ester carboxylesterase